MDNGVARQMFDGWTIAHLMNFYYGQPDSVRALACSTRTTRTGVANINSIFTGSPDVGPRLQPTANPNNGSRSIDNALYDVDAFTLPAIGETDGFAELPADAGDVLERHQCRRRCSAITEAKSLELRASFFNPFNQVRRHGHQHWPDVQDEGRERV